MQIKYCLGFLWNGECVPPGFGKVQIVPRVFDLSPGVFKHPSKSFKTENFLVSQENSNLRFSLESVLIVISSHKQFFLGHPLPPKLSLDLHESVNKTIEIHCDFRLPSRNNPWIWKEFPLSWGLLELICACERRNENLPLPIPGDDECFMCALRGLLRSNKYMEQFWTCLIVLDFLKKRRKQNYNFSLWKRRVDQIFAILAMCLWVQRWQNFSFRSFWPAL